MAPKAILTPIVGWGAMTITLDALGSGAGRQSDMETNSGEYPAALIDLKLSPGTAPTADSIYELYLLRGDDSGNRTDNAGASDAAFTPRNARLIGTLRNPGSTADVQEIFDTRFLGPLGGEWGVAVWNATNQALDSADNFINFTYYNPEIQ